MAFTLRIEAKGIFGNKKIDFTKLISNCRLKYGSNNEFYILEEERINNGTAVLYNPNRIGRGIFFNGQETDKGLIEISYNIPTTKAEITDFIEIVREIESQLKKISMYCVEEERVYTMKELEEQKEQMAENSLKSLREFCRNKEYVSYILTLALWPVTLKEEDVEYFASCTNLDRFEELLHKNQAVDVYYAKPRLLKNNNTGKIGAFYVLTEECESIFPVHAEDFINLDGIKIDEGFIQFYIYSEDRIADGLFKYEKFVAYITENRNIEYFDANHILIPSFTKTEINEIIRNIRE